MKHFDDISLLVDRFLDGETTLAEEHQLDDFFSNHEAELGEMSEHLQIAAVMFRELRSMTTTETYRTKPVKTQSYIKRHTQHWMKWGVAIAAACLVWCFVLFSPKDTSPKLEETAIKVAQLPVSTPPEIINVQQTDSNMTDNQICEVPKNKPGKSRPKPVEHKADQDLNTSATEADETHHEQSMPNGNAMLCGFNPNANMLPMHTDYTTRTVISECEMAILEEEFQMSERNRQTIEI